MVLGLMEAQRDLFADALRVFKGGTTGVAELRRTVTNGTARTWPASVPPELVDVHWEALDNDTANTLAIDITGTPGRTYWFDGRLETPLVEGDKIIVDDVTWQVTGHAQTGNNGPVDAVVAVRRG